MAAGTRTAAANAEIESRCPICLEETQNAYRTECNHRFCGPCIKRALGIKKECPACRAPIASHRKLICEAEETRGAEWEQLMAWQPRLAQRLAHQLASSDGVKEAISNLPEGSVTAPQQQERMQFVPMVLDEPERASDGMAKAASQLVSQQADPAAT